MPRFCLQVRAREAQADTLADEILDIADESVNDFMERFGRDGEVTLVENPETINRSKLRIEARKWYAGKLKPKKYGDSSHLVMGGPNDPIKTKDVSALELLKSRIAGIAARRTEERVP
jgi:hypothetical protein